MKRKTRATSFPFLFGKEVLKKKYLSIDIRYCKIRIFLVAKKRNYNEENDGERCGNGAYDVDV